MTLVRLFFDHPGVLGIEYGLVPEIIGDVDENQYPSGRRGARDQFTPVTAGRSKQQMEMC